MNEQQIIDIIRRYFNPRIDELPPGIPVEGDYLPYWSKRNGKTMRLEAALLNPASSAQPIEFEWIAGRVDEVGNPWPYNQFDLVTRGGVLYQSQVDNNISVPGQVGNDLWVALTKSYSGGWWKAGVYTDEKVVVYSNHTGITQIYELKTPTRPFVSSDIAAEENLGLWVSLTAKRRREVVDTSGAEIVLDFKNADEKFFIGSSTITQKTIWSFLNIDNAVRGNIIFTIGSLNPLEFPQNVGSSLANLDPVTNEWEPFDVGTYKIVFEFDGLGNIYIEIFGPSKGGSNQMPTIFDNTISLTGNVADGPFTYFDPEGDEENNRPPEARNQAIDGGSNPGDTLSVTWDFYSHMGYAQGAHRYQWYTENEDGTNRTPIPGATGQTYNITEADIGKVVIRGTIPVQVAPPPANGNPEGVESFSPGVLVEAVVEEVPTMLDLTQYYDHIADGKDYDAVNFRIPDTGLAGAGGHWVSIAALNRPTYNAGDKSLTFDRTSNIQWLQKAVNDSNAKGSSGTRKWEAVGVFQVDDINTINNQEYAIWSLASAIFMQVEANDIETQNGLIALFNDANLQPNTKYAYRFTSDQNGSNIEMRIQLNYDEVTGTYEYDRTISVVSGGSGWAGATATMGARNAASINRGMKGKQWLLAFLFQDHLVADKQIELWRYLNSK